MPKQQKSKKIKISNKFKNGGYFKMEEADNGIYVFEMDCNGLYEELVKPFKKKIYAKTTKK